MKTILWLLLLLPLPALSGFNSQSKKPYLARWVLNKDCSLAVNGSTNINKFSCVVPHYSRPDTLIFCKDNNGVVCLKGGLNLDILDFDCHNHLMTAELRKILRQKDYPELKISFVSLSKYPTITDEANAVTGIVNIELAGVTKRIEVNYKTVFDNANNLTLLGTQDVCFSDFNIIPPSHLGGMIKTKNTLNIAFNLRIKILN
ncbi:YceI family protein [Mucilaginibacter sp. AW1-3]